VWISLDVSHANKCDSLSRYGREGIALATNCEDLYIKGDQAQGHAELARRIRGEATIATDLMGLPVYHVIRYLLDIVIAVVSDIVSEVIRYYLNLPPQ
jgi:hypothetical protein